MQQPSGFVQGAWWPRSTELIHELPGLLAFLTPRVGRIGRVVYDENIWVPTQLPIAFGGQSVMLEGSRDQSINTMSVIGEDFDKLVLLVVPPYTNPSHAYTAILTASSPEDASTTDELLEIGARAAEDRRLALIAHERWESEGGALCRSRQRATAPAVAGDRVLDVTFDQGEQAARDR